MPKQALSTKPMTAPAAVHANVTIAAMAATIIASSATLAKLSGGVLEVRFQQGNETAHHED